jgi:hypothetical protein
MAKTSKFVHFQTFLALFVHIEDWALALNLHIIHADAFHIKNYLLLISAESALVQF